MTRKFFLPLVFVAMFFPVAVFAQPPRRDDGQRFAPPQHIPRDRYTAPMQSPQVHVPQRSYDRQYHDYRYKSDYGYTYYRPFPPFPPIYPVRPSVVVVPPVIQQYPQIYYGGNYGDWGTPSLYGTSGFSVTVGGRNGSISVTGIQ